MCGIAGVILPRNQAVAPHIVSDLSAALRHRGPDDLGFLRWCRGDERLTVDRNFRETERAELSFIHRRLTIIDKTAGGWQPMVSPDGRFAITYNGEIYNFVELRSELEAEGTAFRSTSDTEVLLAALARWGVKRTLPKLVGMFAFALLDVKLGTVTLARDPFGIKPLCYAGWRNGMAFASEIPALLTLPGLSREADPGALYDYLRFGLTDRGSRSFFSHIRYLPAAHYGVIDLDTPHAVSVVRYWDPPAGSTLDISFEDAAQHLKRLFQESVRLHLRADVPAGALLSGGIDSSAVIAAMREAVGRGHELHGFSYVASGESFDEERWADMAAAATGATLHKVHLSGTDLAVDFDRLIRTQGEPFGTTSIYAQNRVYRTVGEAGLKVVLDGQGADEILAGYTPFLAARLASILRHGDYLSAFRLLDTGAATAGGRAAMALRAARFVLPLKLQGLARRIVGEDLVPAWMNGGWFAAKGVVAAAPQKPVTSHVLRSELTTSLTDTILPSLLRHQDRNSMAYSVESRVPFLTTGLVEFLQQLPENFMISDRGETKAIFRRALCGLVPEQILSRRDKIGFATPNGRWLREMDAEVSEIIDGDVFRSIPALNSSVISGRVRATQSGGRPFSAEVWRCANLARWAELFEVRFQT